LETVSTMAVPDPPRGLAVAYRFGKRWNGSLLDGVEHSAFPEVVS